MDLREPRCNKMHPSLGGWGSCWCAAATRRLLGLKGCFELGLKGCFELGLKGCFDRGLKGCFDRGLCRRSEGRTRGDD